MSNYVTDTHGLIWYLEDAPQLGPGARSAFDACDAGASLIYVPTICLVEIIYLQEKGRLASNLRQQLYAELQTGATGLALADLTAEIAEAVAQIPRGDVPDLPDRIIAATALQLNLPLISRDRKIRLSGLDVVW